jgi:signal transduction histidine kinase
VSKRLLLSYASLVLFVLVVLEVPLAVYYGRNERTALADKVERDAVAIGSLAEGALEHSPEIAVSRLQPIARRYQRETGARAVIVNASGIAFADSATAGARRRDFAARPEILQALRGRVARGVRYSHTLGTNLLYVAVPVASSGVVHGAVRITYPTSAVDSRVHRYWLILAGIGLVVFVVASIIGLRLARSITRPLRAVERAASAVGEGDLDARAPDEGPPEVRALARAINETVAKLDALLDSQQAFVADASHELRTPLTALRLRLENLERDVEPHGRSGLEGAVHEVERLSRVVEGLLALARADAATPALEAVDLGTAVEERLEAWAEVAAERDVTLHAEAAGLAVRSGPERLDQVLDNLLANALSASPPGSSITVSARGAGDWVELHVADEGAGMSAEERERAFDRFWTGGSERAGSGLGLAIVKRLVSSDGGQVELLPAEGGGTDAVVRLRRARLSEPVAVRSG